MKTMIFDIDGTLTDMWQIEKSVLLRMTKRKYGKEMKVLKYSGISDTYKIFTHVMRLRLNKLEYWKLYNRMFVNILKERKTPQLKKYPVVDWIAQNRGRYRFVYATGGQKMETKYALKNLGILRYFDIANSLDKSNCRFSKRTGIPFRKIKRKFPNCVVVADGENDREGARIAGVNFVKASIDYFAWLK